MSDKENFKISVYKYEGRDIMVDIENEDKRVYVDSDFWIKASDLEALNKEVAGNV
jgi:hypothetical protein